MKSLVFMSIAVVATSVLLILIFRTDRSHGPITPDVTLDVAADVAAETKPLPVLSAVPQFTFTDEGGHELGSHQLAGKIWIANFIFTRCPGTCPRQTAQMGLLQQQLQELPEWGEVRLVSFSVDPDYDTPEVLSSYARDAGAEPGHWHFLTGAREDIWQLSKTGFKLDVGEAPPDARSPLFHSPNFVIVDRQSRIRGYYEVMAEGSLERVRKAIQKLLSEAEPGATDTSDLVFLSGPQGVSSDSIGPGGAFASRFTRGVSHLTGRLDPS